MKMQHGVTIGAPIEQVWDVFQDVERWPEWTASMSSVELLDSNELTVGARARIKQPRLPRLVWTVTAIEPGRSWTWRTRGPGATTTATHLLERLDDTTTRVEQTIEQVGVLGVIVARLSARLTRRYLAIEAAGLRRRVEACVSSA
jgi:uncharacterized membrane protein